MCSTTFQNVVGRAHGVAKDRRDLGEGIHLDQEDGQVDYDKTFDLLESRGVVKVDKDGNIVILKDTIELTRAAGKLRNKPRKAPREVEVIRYFGGRKTCIAPGIIRLDFAPGDSIEITVGESVYPLSRATLDAFSATHGNNYIQTMVSFGDDYNIHLDSAQTELFPLVIEYIVRIAANPTVEVYFQVPSDVYDAYECLFDFIFPGRLVDEDQVLDSDGNIQFVVNVEYGLELSPAQMYSTALIRAVLAYEAGDHTIQYSDVFPDNYLDRKMSELRIKTVAAGEPFQVNEYDGSQSVMTLTDFLGGATVLRRRCPI